MEKAKKTEAAISLETIKKHMSANEVEILGSRQCGCVFCRSTYSARKVNDWITDERGISAICPECGIDAVIGDASGLEIAKPSLKKMNQVCFGADYMLHNPEATKTYCHRYEEGKITHKAANEDIYLQYMDLLAADPKEGASFALSLGLLYENGDELVKKDPAKAKKYFSSPSLATDVSALCHLGHLDETGALGAAQPQGAYEMYAKAAALGSLEAVYHLSDCYLKGIFAKPDPRFAFDLLDGRWDEMYANFTIIHKDWGAFPNFALRLGYLYEQGLGVDKDDAMALKLYLMSELSFVLRTAVLGSLVDESEYVDVTSRIAAIAKNHKLKRQEPVFDSDTFADSFEDEAGEDADKEISIVAFDKAEGTLAFDIVYKQAPLIVDVGNLYCGFATGTIRWEFQEVGDVKTAGGKNWQKLDGDNDSGWSFVHVADDLSEDTVAKITFVPAGKKSARELPKVDESLPKGQA